MLKSHIVEIVISDLQSTLPDLEGIYLFGSRADGSANLQSDWDFAFLSRQGLGELQLWELKSSLEAKLNIDIDLIDLYKASTVLQWEVLKTGKIIYSADDFAVQTFEYLTMSFYQKLTEERQGIIDEIVKRGSVYGG